MAGTNGRSGRIRLFPHICIAFGLLLLAISFLIPAQAASQATWDADRARDFQQKALRVHELAHEAGDVDKYGGAEKVKQELADAQKNFDAVNHELSSAVERPRFLKQFLRWTGIAAAATGILAFFVIDDR